MESRDSHGLKGQKKNALIEKILRGKNLYKAYRQVLRNKGASGVDGMGVYELREYLSTCHYDVVGRY